MFLVVISSTFAELDAARNTTHNQLPSCYRRAFDAHMNVSLILLSSELLSCFGGLRVSQPFRSGRLDGFACFGDLPFSGFVFVCFLTFVSIVWVVSLVSFHYF